MVYRENDGKIHFPAMTQLRQLSSIFAFQYHLFCLLPALKNPPLLENYFQPK